MLLDTIKFNDTYHLMLPHLKAINDAVRGSVFVKAQRETYLPHPNGVDTTSPEQVARYGKYISNAEFDEVPAQTLRTWLGKLKIEDTTSEVPERLSYLMNNADGDGLSLLGMVSNVAQNVMEFKWHVLVSDYKGLSSLDLEQVSAADIEQANPRATIKQYDRLNVVDWHFDRINGAMQLTFIMLREVGSTFNRESLSRTSVESFLILALDDDGNYYQQKIVKNADAGYLVGEPSYPMVGSSKLRYLPVEVVADAEFVSGAMPEALGMLSPIVDKALQRYRTSADYKEFLRLLVPTTHVSGLTATDWEAFEEANGRKYVAQGGVNIWPNGAGGQGATINLVGADANNMSGFLTFFDKNEKEIRALGGVFPSDDKKQRTATEVISEAEDDTARFGPMVSAIEQAIKRCIAYCGVFEGVYQADSLEAALDDIQFDMPRNFAVSKLTVEEVKTYMELKMSGLLPDDELLRILDVGGWTLSSAEDLISGMDGG